MQPASPSSNNTSPRTPRRPSISKPMSWLARASSAHSHSHSTASTPSTLRISEPKLVHDMFTTTGGPTYTHSRYGPLGAGATVVRTPQDALARAMLIQAQPYPSVDPPGADDDDGESSYEDDEPEPASPSSPPLPPLPFASKSTPDLAVLSELGELVHAHARNTSSPTHARPTRPCPPAPAARPALKSNPTSPASLPAVPILPLHIAPTPPQPPFAPILLSPVPEVLFDLSSLVVTLETSTSSLRTTYATLTSRPSHLSDYLQTLARSSHERVKRKFRDTLVEEDEDIEENEEDGIQLSSPNTPFASLFAAHLTSAGLLPQSSGMIHLFLDRPSAPYAHIMAYLRSPTANATLPRTASLGARHAQSSERLEALLELRDEAKYLGLDELHKLCCDELRQRQGHVRGGDGSTSSFGSTSSTQQVLLLGGDRGRNRALVQLAAAKVPQFHTGARSSTGSVGNASATSEVAQVEGPPVSPSVQARAMTPLVERSVSRASGSRSRSRGAPHSATDWI